MKQECSVNEIVLNGVPYVKKDSLQAQSSEGLPYVIVRASSAGVFAGYLKSRTKDEVELVNSRRIHYWDGAASLSQLAMEGVKDPSNKSLRFAITVSREIVLGVCELLDTTEKARENIEGVFAWKR